MNYLSILEYAKSLLNTKDISEEELEKDLEIKKIVSFVVVFASTVLTVLNLLNEYYFMALSTSVLTISFLICISLSSDRNNIGIINIIMSIVLGVIFTYYAISGQNNGFAILWVLLIPIMSIIVVGIKNGILLSAYFQILLIFLFYSPIRASMPINYNETFKTRYPILYFVSFSLSIYVTIRNEKYKNDIKNALNFDKTTGLPNRDVYDKQIKKYNFEDAYLFLIKIQGLEYVNIEYGHEVGNRLIKYASDYIRTVFMDKHIVYLIGDGLFAIMAKNGKEDLTKYSKQISNFVFKHKDEKINSISLEVSIASINETETRTFKELEKLAFERLHEISTR